MRAFYSTNTHSASRRLMVSFTNNCYTVVAVGTDSMGAIGATSAETVIQALRSAQVQAVKHGYTLTISTDGSQEAQAIVEVCGDLVARGARG